MAVKYRKNQAMNLSTPSPICLKRRSNLATHHKVSRRSMLDFALSSLIKQQLNCLQRAHHIFCFERAAGHSFSTRTIQPVRRLSVAAPAVLR